MDAELKMEHYLIKPNILVTDIMNIRTLDNEYKQLIKELRVKDVLTREFLINLAVDLGYKSLDINITQDMVVWAREWDKTKLFIHLKRR